MPAKKIIPLLSVTILCFLFVSCHSRQDWSVIFMKKGREYAKKGKYELAAAEYEKASRINRKNRQVYFDSGDLFWKMNLPKRVIEMINMAEEIDPDLPAQYAALKAESMLVDGQIKGSFVYFYKAAEKEPANEGYRKRRDELRAKVLVLDPQFEKVSGLVF